MELRGVFIYRDLTAWVTPFALKAVNEQFRRLKSEPTAIVPCTGTFTTTIGLPCAHKIQERWYDRTGGNVLKLKDIHPHWRFTKPPRARQATEEQEEEDHTMGGNEEVTEVPGTPPGTAPPPEEPELPADVLRVQEPAVVKAKGRPRGSMNMLWAPPAQRPTASQRRRRQAFENSTQRAPSAFEYAPELPSSQVPDSQPPRSQREGRQRGGQRGGRGGVRGRAAEGQNAGVPASYMGSFQMQISKLEVQLEVDSEHAKDVSGCLRGHWTLKLPDQA